jgi:hypothetical protein
MSRDYSKVHPHTIELMHSALKTHPDARLGPGSLVNQALAALEREAPELETYSEVSQQALAFVDRVGATTGPLPALSEAALIRDLQGLGKRLRAAKARETPATPQAAPAPAPESYAAVASEAVGHLAGLRARRPGLGLSFAEGEDIRSLGERLRAAAARERT